MIEIVTVNIFNTVRVNKLINFHTIIFALISLDSWNAMLSFDEKRLSPIDVKSKILIFSKKNC
jgi:hypothetical protein